jgi:CheY-like chemotaxis protein/phosphoribosyl 1,2-cyclic phosphodiesterase
LRLRFWGTRGSIATPGPGTLRFGGNTSCVEAVTGAGQRLVFDCGTGARLLGAHLMANAPKPISATILLSHTHWDHIQGFPFFAPAFVPGNKLTVCAPEGCTGSLPDALAGQMQYAYFPVALGQLGASIEYRELKEGTSDIDGIRISTQYLNHPAIALGYKVEADDVTVLYLCDHEPYSETLWRADAEPGHIDAILHANDRRHARFMAGADVVVHDAQYTPEEYPAKKNWGHSTYDYVVQIAAAAGVRRLFLTHHDPLHDDAFTEDIEQRARAMAARIGSAMEVVCAFEGCEETVQPRAAGTRSIADSDTAVTARLENIGLKILIVDDDEDLRLLAGRVLKQSGHFVSEAPGGAEALEIIRGNQPDLIILDLNMPPPDGIEVLRILRSRKETASLPVVVLTARGDESSTRLSFDVGATDFLSKPFTPPQLDARVRTSFARAAGKGT